MEGQIEGGNDDKIVQGRFVCDSLFASDTAALKVDATLEPMFVLLGGDLRVGVGPKGWSPSVVFVPAPTGPIGFLGLRQGEQDRYEQDCCYNALTISTDSSFVPHKSSRLGVLAFRSLDIKQIWPRGSLEVLYAKATQEQTNSTAIYFSTNYHQRRLPGYLTLKV